MLANITSVDELARMVPDGAQIALAPEYSYCSLAITRALIRRGARDLDLLGVPTMGLMADLLIGAGCVARVETAAVTLGEFGIAPRFIDAVKNATIDMKDSTCPAIHAALQAGEKGIPFMVLRGILGTDILARRPDWKVANNPFAEDDPIVYLPALRPEVAILHAPKADKFGNVWVGVRRELMLMAHASKNTIATAEEIIDGNLLDDAAMAAGTIPAIYINAVAEAKEGAWPLGAPDCYGPDKQHLTDYVQMAQTQAGFEQYLDRYVRRPVAAE
jgi:glutaconate CoA-transferase subunit A